MDALSTTFKKLRNIKEESSKKNKALLVKSYLTCDIFAKCMLLMFDEKKKFKINELPPTENTDSMDESYIFDFLDSLSKSKGVNDDQKQLLADACGNGMTRKVVERILLKSSDAGFGLRTLNTVAPGFLFETPYMRCSSWEKFKDDGKWPKYIQEKADAQFAYNVTEEFDEPFLTRRGKGYNMLGAQIEEDVKRLSAELATDFGEDVVVVGEMIITDDKGVPLDRGTSNGLVNKMIAKKGSREIADRAIYRVWDVIPVSKFHCRRFDESYGVRFEALEVCMTFINADSAAKPRVELIESHLVNSVAEAEEFFEKMRSEGKEGAVLKNYNSIWRHTKSGSNEVWKMKHFAEAEFRVVGATEGKGKFVGKVGAVVYESEDGLVFGKVGSGLSGDPQHEERSFEYWFENIGNIVTLKFECVSENKNKKPTKFKYFDGGVAQAVMVVEPHIKTLSTPSFVETRFNEKTAADTLEYLEGL